MAGAKKKTKDGKKTALTKTALTKTGLTKTGLTKKASTKDGSKARADTLAREPVGLVEPLPAPAPVIAEPVVVARRGALTEMVPVRFDVPTLAALKQAAAADHRSVSSWIRRAVDLELQRNRV